MSLDHVIPIQTHPIAGVGPYGTGWPYIAGAITAAIIRADGTRLALADHEFTVDPPAAEVSGNVFLPIPLALIEAGSTLMLERLTDVEQGWEGRQSARERGLERQLDYMVMVQQELRAGLARSLRVSTSVGLFVPSGPGVSVIWDGANFVSGPRVDQIAAAASGAAEILAVAEQLLSVPLRTFATRAAAVTAIARGDLDAAPDGAVIWFDGYAVKRVTGWSVIPDMPGWEPVGAWTVVHWGGVSGQDIVVPFRRMADAALDLLIASGGSASVAIHLPRGRWFASDELLSDDFQQRWLAHTGLFVGMRLDIVWDKGATLWVKNYISGVRNAENVNMRTYGPWAGQPSPSALFPVITLFNSPASVSLIDARIVGSRVNGRDPIVLLTANMIEADHRDWNVRIFRNTVVAISGSFNSSLREIRMVANGLQPLEGGAILGNPAGIHPTDVRFDFVASTGLLTAKRAGAEVGYFSAAHVGKTIFIGNAARFTGPTNTRPLKATITAYISPSRVTVTPFTFTGQTVINCTDYFASFAPLRATTVAGNPVVTLSDHVLVGRGARDMLGHMVTIPKAGSTRNIESDLFTSRIVALGDGNDVTGYRKVTLASAPRFSVNEDFIWSANLLTQSEETLLEAGLTMRELNDVDLRGIQAENLTPMSAYIAVLGRMSYCQVKDFKFHGVSASTANFCGEGQVILDMPWNTTFADGDFTHFCLKATGAVRIMGGSGATTVDSPMVKISNCSALGWKIGPDAKCVYLDPRAGFDADAWSVIVEDVHATEVKFPYIAAQAIIGVSSLVTSYQRHLITAPKAQHHPVPVLGSEVNLDDVTAPGVYYLTGSMPVGTPPFYQYSYLFVTGDATGRVLQTLEGVDDARRMRRTRFNNVWRPFEATGQYLASATAAQLASATSAANVAAGIGKVIGGQIINSTDNKIYYARGSAPTDQWVAADGGTVITPT